MKRHILIKHLTEHNFVQQHLNELRAVTDEEQYLKIITNTVFFTP